MSATCLRLHRCVNVGMSAVSRLGRCFFLLTEAMLGWLWTAFAQSKADVADGAGCLDVAQMCVDCLRKQL